MVIPEIEAYDLEIDANLQMLGMNSLEFIRIIVMLEDKLGIEIPDEHLLIPQMNTIRKISNVLCKILEK